jgi:hypothetical protein
MKTRRNVQHGFYGADGVFHPIRACSDYDPDRLFEEEIGSGRKRKAKAKSKAKKSKAKTKGKKNPAHVRSISKSVKGLMSKLNPGRNVKAVKIQRLKGGGVTIQPIKVNRI